MDMNRIMIMFAGLFLIIFTSFQWKINHVIWDRRKIKVCAIILGLYNVVLAICFKQDWILLFLLDYILYLILDLIFLLIRIRADRKGLFKVIYLGLCFILIAISLLIILLDQSEVYSSVAILSGVMMVISVSFSDIKRLKNE